MIRGLLEAGYPAAYLLAVDLDPDDGDNIIAAKDQISADMDTLLVRAAQAFIGSECAGSGPTKGTIVAHSMGAVSGRWYATKVAPTKVRTFISLAGANHGTNALCGLIGKGNQQMCPAFSENDELENVQTLLNGTEANPVDETPYGIGTNENEFTRIPPDSTRHILYLTVRLQPDEWIEPAHSASLVGAGGARISAVNELSLTESSEGNYVFHGSTSHDRMPSHPDIVRFVRQSLSSIADQLGSIKAHGN